MVNQLRYALRASLRVHTLRYPEMKKITLILVGLALIMASFLSGAMWEEKQTSRAILEKWSAITNWTEDEQNQFLELSQDVKMTPEEYIKLVENTAKVSEATVEMMRNDEAMSVAHCIHILSLTQGGDLLQIKSFCIERMASYYNQNHEGLPELAMKGINQVKKRIEADSLKHPELQKQLKGNQSR